ncbi:hypothetical protein [Streptacidiphilus sp. MAP12-33]|uniref:hypothetical protein n=1 Tax=Streptacidiphilus sp. MAP12-33 TaxID=3156266 RepID=UPI0035137500
MHRWDPLNEIQLVLLRRIAAGGAGEVQARERTTGYALRNRGLITVDRRGGRWVPEMTDAGRFYLEHGRHPDHPSPEASGGADPVAATPNEMSTQVPTAAAPGRRQPKAIRAAARPRVASAGALVPKSSAARLAEAKALVARLVEERQIVIHDVTDEVVKDRRRVIEYAKRHELVPEGRHIETQRMWHPEPHRFEWRLDSLRGLSHGTSLPLPR